MYQSSAPPSADSQLCPWVVVFMGWASVGFHGLLPSWSGFPWVFVFGSGFHEFLSSWGWVSMGFHGFLPSWGGFPLVSMVFVVVLGWISMFFVVFFFFFCPLGVSFHGFLSFWSWFPWVLVFLTWFLWVFSFLRWVSAGFHVFLLSWGGFP